MNIFIPVPCSCHHFVPIHTWTQIPFISNESCPSCAANPVCVTCIIYFTWLHSISDLSCRERREPLACGRQLHRQELVSWPNSTKRRWHNDQCSYAVSSTIPETRTHLIQYKRPDWIFAESVGNEHSQDLKQSWEYEILLNRPFGRPKALVL